jgi:Asp-tRNA(Asn)/Glu-tRNA(Gln) amidotransferase A subunit family amidase
MFGAHRIEQAHGVLPLSFTLDSAGPIAKTVADCALFDRVLAAEAKDVPAPAHLRSLRQQQDRRLAHSPEHDNRVAADVP